MRFVLSSLIENSMGSGAPPFGFGVQFLFDNHQRFVRSGLKVYLRVKNFPESGDALEVGVPGYAPNDTADAQVGYTDYLIQPPPNVQDISMHNLAMAAQTGLQLMFGSKVFTISRSWVDSQIQLMLEKSGIEVTDPYAVFRDRDGKGNALGLVYNGRLLNIGPITHRDVSGRTVSYKVIGAAYEQKLADSPESIAK